MNCQSIIVWLIFLFCHQSIAAKLLVFVLLEAMASGLPCLASNLPGVRKVIDESCGLLVNPGEAGDLAKKIISLLSNKDLSLSMSKASRVRAVAKFSFDQPSELPAFYLKKQ